MNTMKPICSVDCVDCGTSIIVDPSMVSITVLDKQPTAIAECVHCERILIDDITVEYAIKMISKGVKAFAWDSLEEVTEEFFNGVQ